MTTRAIADSPGEPPSAGSKAPVALVSCGILRDEIEAVIRSKGLSCPIFYLAPAPCINYRSLEKQLTVLLKRAAQTADRVAVEIGRCHPDLDAILARQGAVRLPMDSCFAALLGPRMKELLAETNTFFTTPAWLKHWRRAFRQGMRWDEVDVRQNFGVYKRILILDAGVTPCSDEEILELFDFTQVPVEVLPIDLDHFATLLVEALKKT